jgi:hypothetical protein
LIWIEFYLNQILYNSWKKKYLSFFLLKASKFRKQKCINYKNAHFIGFSTKPSVKKPQTFPFLSGDLCLLRRTINKQFFLAFSTITNIYRVICFTLGGNFYLKSFKIIIKNAQLNVISSSRQWSETRGWSEEFRLTIQLYYKFLNLNFIFLFEKLN